MAKGASSAGARRELDAMSIAHGVLNRLAPDERARALRWLFERLGIELGATGPAAAPAPIAAADNNARSFIDRKKPLTDAERAACLAYHLSRHQRRERVEVRDVSRLNASAGLPPFSNPTMAIRAATGKGLIARQRSGALNVTALGARFVEMLPRRLQAVAMLKAARRTRNAR